LLDSVKRDRPTLRRQEQGDSGGRQYHQPKIDLGSAASWLLSCIACFLGIKLDMLVARALKYSQLSCGHMSTYETMHYKINLQIFMIKTRSLFQNFSTLGLRCLLLGTLSGSTLADSDDSSGPESRQPLLRPIGVVSASGNVQNAETLVAGNGGYTILTWGGQGPAPMIILDYGRDVGGLPVFEVSSVSGTPQLQAIYSESQQNLLPAGDGAPGFPNAPGDPSRVDTYPVSGPGLIVNRLVQGGERFEAITLVASGTVTLLRAGIRSTTFSPAPSANLGSFRSSDSPVSVYVDGRLIAGFEVPVTGFPSAAAGSFGFENAQGAEALFRNLSVVSSGGQILASAWKSTCRPKPVALSGCRDLQIRTL
jgi:hypothetical protein